MRILLIFIFVFLYQCTSNYNAAIRFDTKNDPYCEVKSKTVNQTDGNETMNKSSTTTVECDDGPKSFMKKSGLASDCRFFTWRMPLGHTDIEQRSISCKRLDGKGYEILPNYSLQY